MIPNWFQFLLLALAAFRVWRLLAEDDILDRPRRRLLRLNKDNEPPPEREEAALFLICPWCAGFWVSGLVYLGWLFTLGDPTLDLESVLVGVGVWFALSATVGLIRGNLDPPEE